MPVSEVTLERVESEFKNKYRENFEESLKQAIDQTGVVVTRKPTDKEIRYMQMYMNGEVTYQELQLAISRVGEKIACMIF